MRLQRNDDAYGTLLGRLRRPKSATKVRVQPREEVMISRLTLPWVPDERSLFFACRGKDLADETQYANSASFEGLHRPSFVNAAQMLSS